jgi:HlyD family secretion protein
MSKNETGLLAGALARGIPVALALTMVGCKARSPWAGGFQGIVEYEERRLSFEVGGRVEHVDVRRGDVFADGKVLAGLDDSLEKLARDARAASVAAARADLALLESGPRREDLGALAAQVRAAAASEELLGKVAARARALRAAEGISQAELDRANAEHERATAERKSAEQRRASLARGAHPQELARARARLDGASVELTMEDERIARYTLKAEAPGEVLDVHVEPGETAAPGAPVVTVADTSRPYAEVFVPQGDLAGIHAGVKATVHVDAGDAALPGTVTHVASRTEFTPRYVFSESERPNLVVRVRVSIDDPSRKMHAGVPAFVTFAR